MSIIVDFCLCRRTSLFLHSIYRNDALEDRYSVLIKFVNQLKADGFYCDFNGKRFSSTEVADPARSVHWINFNLIPFYFDFNFVVDGGIQAEVCHVLFMYSVECTEFAELASVPPAGFTELPTCPVCLGKSVTKLSLRSSTLFPI